MVERGVVPLPRCPCQPLTRMHSCAAATFHELAMLVAPEVCGGSYCDAAASYAASAAPLRPRKRKSAGAGRKMRGSAGKHLQQRRTSTQMVPATSAEGVAPVAGVGVGAAEGGEKGGLSAADFRRRVGRVLIR